MACRVTPKFKHPYVKGLSSKVYFGLRNHYLIKQLYCLCNYCNLLQSNIDDYIDELFFTIAPFKFANTAFLLLDPNAFVSISQSLVTYSEIPFL